MALTEHQSTFLEASASRSVSSEFLNIDDELDRVQMDIDAGRFSEARSKFVRMDRALRETPRALILRAKSSPSRNSHEMIASVAREQAGRASDPVARIQLATALALCGDYRWAESTLPGSTGLTATASAARREAVKLIGSDPEVTPNKRGTIERFMERWMGIGSK